MIAIPRFTAPRLSLAGVRSLLDGPYLSAVVAAVLFVGALVVLVGLFGPVGGGGHVKVRLEQIAHAPAGWREALRRPHGAPTVSEDVLQLFARPLAPASAANRTTPLPLPSPFVPGAPLPTAPIAGFYAPGPGGPLPIIAQDGRTSAQVYARPFFADGRPKVALVIGGLGLNARATQQAIETLRPEVTLSFVAYAEGLQGWIDMARAHGHEVLLETPMEPMDYPDNDPGPYTLMTDAQAPDTLKKLEWVLSRATGYFGLTNYLGSRFLGSDAAYQTFIGAA
ncbi:MAG: divergent polysaccharide deacetylase family protein, partial [Phenylobacterium sp.]